MNLKLSPDLRRMVENGKLSLEKEETPKLIINMGNTGNPKLKINMGNKKTLAESYPSSLSEITDYVAKHTSGVKHEYELAEGGSIMVTFDEFQKMVNEGYNIYKSEVISENFISIQYQKEIKREERGK